MQTKSETISKKIFFYFTCVLWTYNTLFKYVSVILSRLPFFGDFFLNYFRLIVLILLLIGSLPYILGKLDIIDVFYTIIVLLVVCVTVLINSKYNQEFINTYIWIFVLQCYPMIFMGRVILNILYDDRNVRYLGLISLLCLISTILVIIQSGANIQADWSGSMYYSYIILPHVLCVFYIAVNYNNIMYLFISILGFIFMVMLGNRGSLICSIIFFVICLYRYFMKLSLHKKIISIVVFLFLIVIFTVGNFYNSFLLNIYNYASTHGLSTRLFYFMKGEINSPFDSGRSILRKKVIKAISDNILGYGLSSDVFFAGAYVHNIFLELIVEFGVFFGFILILGIVWLIFSALIKNNIPWNIKNIFCIFICCGLIKLCISGTYLTDPYIFFMLGMAISLCNIRDTAS